MSRNCHGGYPDSSTVGPNSIKRFGSPMMLSVISASMSSWLISFDSILPRWDISVRVLVKSTNESRPSSFERSSTEICCKEPGSVSVVDVADEDSMDGTWGALIDNAG